jgi:hypothetical protein
MTASGFGASVPKDASAVWPSLGAGVQSRWALGGVFSIALGIQGVVPTVTQRFHIDGTPNGPVFSVAPVVGRAEIGPELRF